MGVIGMMGCGFGFLVVWWIGFDEWDGCLAGASPAKIASLFRAPFALRKGRGVGNHGVFARRKGVVLVIAVYSFVDRGLCWR